jgi:hypothetical protein
MTEVSAAIDGFSQKTIKEFADKYVKDSLNRIRQNKGEKNLFRRLTHAIRPGHSSQTSI